MSNDTEDKKLYEESVYANVDDIRFGMWLEQNGWEFYDSEDRMINQKAGNVVWSIRNLFAEYKKEVHHD